MVEQRIIPGLDHFFLNGQWQPTPDYHRIASVKKIIRKPSAKGEAQREAQRRTIPLPLGNGLATRGMEPRLRQ